MVRLWAVEFGLEVEGVLEMDPVLGVEWVVRRNPVLGVEGVVQIDRVLGGKWVLEVERIVRVLGVGWGLEVVQRRVMAGGYVV